MTLNEYETAAADALTAQGGFFASGPDLPDLPLEARYRDLMARYRGLVDRLPAVIYLDGVGDDDTMVDVSPGVEELLGITRDEWLSGFMAW